MQVSVAMAAYNSERFLAEAIESVLAQTHSDFELIIVDDGSKDRTAEILAHYAARDSRIVVLHQENQGIAGACNRAIFAARNELVSKIDSDDRMLPNRLERQIEFLQQHPEITVASSYYYMIDVRGKRIGSSGMGYADGTADARAANPLNVVWIHNTTVMMRKSDILELGGYSRECTRGEEDRDLWGRLLTAGKIIKCQPEFLTEYRLHSGAFTAKHAVVTLRALRFVETNIVRRLQGEAELSMEEFDRQARALSLWDRFHERRTLVSFGYYNQATRYYGERKLFHFVLLFGLSVALRPFATLSRAAKRLKRN